MAQIQPPNTQTLRPQHLTQVGHEGNPVETCALEVTGTLDSPSYYDCEGADLGGPILYPTVGAGGPGGSESSPIGEMVIGGGNMDCSGSASVVLTITGGVAPYSWETDVGTLSATTGVSVTLTPSVNSGSGVVGDAYRKVSKYLATCSIGGTTDCVQNTYNCAGAISSECSGVNTQACLAECYSGASCSGFYPGTPPPAFADSHASACASAKGLSVADACAGPESYTMCVCDVRSAPMISNGCNPCEIQFMNGATVIVTDSTGHQAYFGIET